MGALIDPKLSQQIILAIRGALWTSDPASAVREAGGIPFPTIAFKPAHRRLVQIVGVFASGASPASKQLYTTTAGKVFRAILFVVGNNSGTQTFVVLRDAIADSGSQRVNATVYAVNGLNLALPENYPLDFQNGIRFDASDQLANTNYRFIIVGWEEDSGTADPISVTTVS